MAKPNQEAIDTFISITGVSQPVAIQKLEEHGGDLNEAVNAHFSDGGNRSITHETSVASSLQEDLMDIDDPLPVPPRRLPFSLLHSARNMSPFSLLDPNFNSSIFNSGTGFTTRSPYVSHPREVREIPIEVKDGNENSSHPGMSPTIEDVTGTADEVGPEIHGTVIVSDDDDSPVHPTARVGGWNEEIFDVFGDTSHVPETRPSAPEIDDVPDYNNDIEEEMIRAAIEASKRDAEINNPMLQTRQIPIDDTDLAYAVSLSLKTAEQEKVLHELGGKVGPSQSKRFKPVEMENLGKLAPSNGGLEVGGSSVQDEAEDVEEQQLVRRRGRRIPSAPVDTAEEIDIIPSSSPQQQADFHTDEWGGISSVEHDEAVMLEAALFGETHNGSRYKIPYAPHQFMQSGRGRTVGTYHPRIPRPPSPSLTAQRLIREQQDDEYLAALQADKEKELKAIEEAENRRLEEQATKEATLAEEKRKEEELQRKLEEEQEFERQLAAKEASLPEEPSPDDENSVTLLVRMPDGSRRGRRFLNSHKLKNLFDFIDVGRVIKPGTYRLVRPYPRRAFSGGDSSLTLNELGLTSKQEALFLELI